MQHSVESACSQDHYYMLYLIVIIVWEKTNSYTLNFMFSPFNTNLNLHI